MWPILYLRRRSLLTFFAIAALFLSTTSAAQAQTLITPKSIIDVTNAARRSGGETTLISDGELGQIAKARVEDMFARQYFAHKGPTGQTVGKLAAEDGYEYAMIGENLALGYYEDADELVGAWMESQGHRKNILRDDYTSIGVAIGTGVFEGEESIIAVQVFSRPLSLCQRPSRELRESIIAGQTYVQKVRSFVNAYVRSGASLPYAIGNQVSTLMALFTNDLDKKVAQYNKQVKAFEACARG